LKARTEAVIEVNEPDLEEYRRVDDEKKNDDDTEKNGLVKNENNNDGDTDLYSSDEEQEDGIGYIFGKSYRHYKF
jgi:hypothetical protein